MKQTYIVKKEEFICRKGDGGDGGQVLLSILKEKGAPIKGSFHLEVMPGYEYEITKDMVTGDTLVIFTEL